MTVMSNWSAGEEAAFVGLVLDSAWTSGGNVDPVWIDVMCALGL